jgi:hypothetical protein
MMSPKSMSISHMKYQSGLGGYEMNRKLVLQNGRLITHGSMLVQTHQIVVIAMRTRKNSVRTASQQCRHHSSPSKLLLCQVVVLLPLSQYMYPKKSQTISLGGKACHRTQIHITPVLRWASASGCWRRIGRLSGRRGGSFQLRQLIGRRDTIGKTLMEPAKLVGWSRIIYKTVPPAK